MEIGFSDAKLQRLFCDFRALKLQYGREMAAVISRRLGLLKAAPNLESIPRRPPISLSRVDGTLNRYTIALNSTHRLSFISGDLGRLSSHKKAAEVPTIEILGVES